MGAKAGATGTPRLETLTQWLNASPQERELALQPCLDRIQAMDPSIHAWVQVMPEKPTGNGKLAGIPFGAKDIIETRGLATEYGSPIYKGRIGTEDAAIIREMRKRGAILDTGVSTAAGLLLRRYRIQAQLRFAVHGWRAALGEKPGHARLFHTYTSRYAPALGINGTSYWQGGEFCPRRPRTHA